MAERKFTLKELHYITEKLIANGEMETGAISADIVASVLPDNHKDKAAEIHAALLQEGLLDAKTEQIACSEYSAIKINYFNADPDLTPEQRAEAEKSAIEAILAGDLSKIKDTEEFIIDGFKLSYEDGKTVLSPVSNSATLSNFSQIYELFNKDGVSIDTFDLTAPHNGEVVAGELGLTRNDQAISVIEAGPEDLTYAMSIFERSDAIPTKDDVFFVAPGVENANEVVQRINNGGDIIPGDCVLTNGVLYSFKGDNNKIVCEACKYGKDAEIKDDRFGFRVTVPAERSAGDDVLGDDLGDEENNNNAPTTPVTPNPQEQGEKGKDDEDQAIDNNTMPYTKAPPKVGKGEVVHGYAKKVTNSPYFGYGETMEYKAVAPTANAQYVARTLNGNEQMRIAAEIKVNQFYAEKARLKSMQKMYDKGIVGLFKKALRLVRATVYFIAKPFVKDLGLFAYNKSIDDLNKKIKDAKEAYYNVKDNNKKFIKRYEVNLDEHNLTEAQRREWDERHASDDPNKVTVADLDIAPETMDNVPGDGQPENTQPDKKDPQVVPGKAPETHDDAEVDAPEVQGDDTKAKPVESKKVEVPVPQENEVKPNANQAPQKKVDPRKRLAKDLMAVAPARCELKMQTEKKENSDKYKTTVTLMRPEGDQKKEIKLDYDFDKLTNNTNVAMSDKVLADLQQRILVAQQISKGKADKAGISEEAWNKPSGKHKHSKAMDAEELISGEASQKRFHVNGIETNVTVNEGLVYVSALGGTDVFTMSTFAEQPREVINLTVHNMAVNKYMEYVCDKIPDMLCDEKKSKHFQNVAQGNIDFSTPQIHQSACGRPIIAIPTYVAKEGENPLGAVIKIDTNNGEISWASQEKDKFSPADIKKMNQVLEVVRGKYATEMLEFTSADVIYGDAYVGRVAGDIGKAIQSLDANNKEADIVVSGINVHVSRENSGTYKVHMSDRDGKHAEEFSCYGSKNELLGIAEAAQKIGRISLAQDRAEYVKQEAFAQREQMQLDGNTTKYGNAHNGPIRLKDDGPNIDEIPDEIDRE